MFFYETYSIHLTVTIISGRYQGVSPLVCFQLYYFWKLYWYILFLKRFGWCWNVSRRKVTSRSPSWSQPCLGWGVPSHPPLSGLQILTEKDEGEERTMRTNWHQATSKSGTMGGPLGILAILTISLQGEVFIFFLFSLISLFFWGILDLSSQIASLYSHIETLSQGCLVRCLFIHFMISSWHAFLSILRYFWPYQVI